MTPAPDGLCMVGQELSREYAKFCREAYATRHKDLGTQWEASAPDIFKAFMHHIDRCKICKRTIAQ